MYMLIQGCLNQNSLYLVFSFLPSQVKLQGLCIPPRPQKLLFFLCCKNENLHIILNCQSTARNATNIMGKSQNKSTALCQRSAVRCLIEDKESKKRAKFLKKMHFESSRLIVWIALWIVNTYFQFQGNVFSNNRDITNCQSFCTTNDTAARQRRRQRQGNSNTSGFLWKQSSQWCQPAYLLLQLIAFYLYKRPNTYVYSITWTTFNQLLENALD